MSYRAMSWAIEQKVGDVNAKAALFVLAYHMNDTTGLCCPSNLTLREEMEVKAEATVRRAINRLESLGLITVNKIYGDRKNIIRTEYKLLMNVRNDVTEVRNLITEVRNEITDGTESRNGGVRNDVTCNKEIEQGSKQEIHPTENSAPKESLISEEELFSELPPPSDEDIRATVTVTESSPKKRNTTPQEVVEKPEGVDDDLWKEWNQFRKKKRAPVTPRVLSNLARQTSNAGISISEGMVIQMEQGWTGFQASWIKPDMRHTANNAPQVDEWTQKNLGKKINGQTVLLRQEQRVYGNKLFQQYKKEAA